MAQRHNALYARVLRLVARFVRIHRSYLVNLERVVKIEPYTKDSRVVVLADGAQLPVSRAGYARLQALFEGKG